MAVVRSPEALFDDLHGQATVVGNRAWSIDVFSVSDLAGDRWVQLAVHGDEDRMLTLRLAPWDGPDEVLAAVKMRLVERSDEHLFGSGA